jgi:hypothetical protein
MLVLELSEEERVYLLSLLEGGLQAKIYEIRHTFSQDFKARLRKEANLIERLTAHVKQLVPAEPVGPAA